LTIHIFIWYNEVAPILRLLKNYLLRNFKKGIDRAILPCYTIDTVKRGKKGTEQ
jgi:hypothetical protein